MSERRPPGDDEPGYEQDNDERRTPEWTADEGEPDVQPFAEPPAQEDDPAHGYGYE